MSLIGFAALALIVHELGHLLAARSCNVPASELVLGMGPRLTGFRLGTDTVVWFGCDDITGIDCRYNVGDGRDASKRQFDVVNTVSRPSASYLERLGTFPLSRDSIALPRSNDARLPLLNIETGTISTLSTGSSFFRALAMYWTTDGEWLLIHASKTVVRGVNARTGGVAEITLPIESAGDIAVGAR